MLPIGSATIGAPPASPGVWSGLAPPSGERHIDPAPPAIRASPPTSPGIPNDAAPLAGESAIGV